MPAIGHEQVLYGPDGEQFNIYTSRRWPLGTQLILQDGRRFRFVRNGAVAMVPGKLYQSELPDPDHDTLAVVSGTLGARAIRLTNGADTIEADLYADGYIVTEAAAGASPGRLYRIAGSHAAITNATDGNIPLAGGSGLQAALNTSDTVTLVKSPYADVIVHPSPPTAMVVGVAMGAVAAAGFGWVQTRGITPCLIDGTVTIGLSVMPSNAIDGSVEAWALTEGTPNVELYPAIGRVIEVAPDTGYGLIYLELD